MPCAIPTIFTETTRPQVGISQGGQVIKLAETSSGYFQTRPVILQGVPQQQAMCEKSKEHTEEIRANPKTVLEITVHNHPGVMAIICGLFARRSLQQVEKQLLKLVDVIDLKHHGTNHRIFEELKDYFQHE